MNGRTAIKCGRAREGHPMFNYLKSQITNLLVEEDGQDGFEYLLVVGGISVAVVVAAAAAGGLVDPLVDGVCDAINTAVPVTCP
jgi:Flp pilus assembly pilin Flp